MSKDNIKIWPKASGENPEHNGDEASISDENQPSAGVSKRTIYLLPNLFTTGALFGGFYAILMSLQGNIQAAAVAIFAAQFFDGLDGRVARLTNTQSEFGVEYDSLSDMVSFGVAPAILMYTWMLEPLGTFGFSAAFIYTACAALRLARFNVKSAGDDRRYFLGLASPPAAALIWGSAWTWHAIEPSAFISVCFAILTIGVGLLMVSGVRYHSFKDINLANRVPFAVVFAIVIGISVIMIDPPIVLLAMAVIYAVYAPCLLLYFYIKKGGFKLGS